MKAVVQIRKFHVQSISSVWKMHIFLHVLKLKLLREFAHASDPCCEVHVDLWIGASRKEGQRKPGVAIVIELLQPLPQLRPT